MQRETDLPLPVRCETCGVEYQATQERCPRCNSNQRSKPIAPAHPLKQAPLKG